MLPRTTPITGTMAKLLAEGFTVTDVDSTDDELILVLTNPPVQRTLRLDRGETRELAEHLLFGRPPVPTPL